jgi:hypothetical protein
MEKYFDIPNFSDALHLHCLLEFISRGTPMNLKEALEVVINLFEPTCLYQLLSSGSYKLVLPFLPQVTRHLILLK